MKTSHPLYKVWRSLLQRNGCTADAVKRDKCEGKRPAYTVCPAWRKSFDCFIADIPAKPGPGYYLCRVNPDVAYRPGNVVWRTRAETAKVLAEIRQVQPVAEDFNTGQHRIQWQRIRMLASTDPLWRASLAAFTTGVGPKPASDGQYKLCRINTLLGYIPGNVEWRLRCKPMG